ncbi:MAG: ABC transporter ATP-binding protein, partial [Actinomycetota bacterium]|nr:ABC transporter ATP-binding protein [Actinomycetota bacterium]
MTDAAIVAEDLGKRFGDVIAVDGVDLSVPAGTVLGLLGPNGAGKTTIVRVLTTILRPDRGRALVLGHDVAAEPHVVRASIGLAGQYAAVDENLTGRENLRMVGKLTHLPRPAIAARADELLERFELGAVAHRVTAGFSHGMGRRLSVVLAAFHEPRVLLLDEPFDGVDPVGVEATMDVIADARARGAAVLVSTHLRELAVQACQDAIVLRGGS